MAEAMKDSGIRWVGVIPTSWEVKKNKYVFRNTKRLVGNKWSDTQLLSLTKKGVREKDIDEGGGKQPDSFSTYQYVSKNDLVMCLFDLDQSAVFSGLSYFEGMISPAYKILNCEKNFYYGYAAYWFDFVFDGRKYKNYSKNIRYTLDYDEFGKLPIVVPPIEEQKKIADFLDEKCAEIDKLSEDIQKQINVLNDYKKSVIFHAITKGLDSNVEMKNSGIEWIGSIPLNWKIARVKDSFKMQSGFTPDSKRYDYYDDYDGYNWVTIADIKKDSTLPLSTMSKISKKYVEVFHPRMAKAGCLLYSFKLSLGQVAFVREDVYTNEAIMCFSCKNENSLRFLKYSSSLIEYNANTNIYGSKILNQQLIGDAHITMPPIDEQERIADFLDEICSKINDSIVAKEEQLSKIIDYKKSIIYEYVTGKKRVKGAK